MDFTNAAFFEELYKSDLQAAYALWVVPLLFLGWLLISPRARDRAETGDADARFVHVYAIVWSVVAILDSFATVFLVRWLGIAGTGLGTAVLVAFVMLGDFRVFLLVFRLARPERAYARTLRSAALWTIIVPLFSFWSDLGLRTVVPTLPGEAIWLTYELAFLAVAMFLRNGWLPARLASMPKDRFDYLSEVTSYVSVYYALWALADIAILVGGLDLGWALRMIPNQLYYAFFVPFVYVRFFARR